MIRQMTDSHGYPNLGTNTKEGSEFSSQKTFNSEEVSFPVDLRYVFLS